jgi:hypothetical protein
MSLFKKKNTPIKASTRLLTTDDKIKTTPESIDKLTVLFNELINREDYKPFTYHSLELKTPHQNQVGLKHDIPQTNYDVYKTVLYHYAENHEQNIHSNETEIITRYIKKFEGKELSREYKLADNIRSSDQIPRPDLKARKIKREELERATKEAERKKHAANAVKVQQQSRRDRAEQVLRVQNIPFANGSSTEDLERFATAISSTK